MRMVQVLAESLYALTCTYCCFVSKKLLRYRLICLGQDVGTETRLDKRVAFRGTPLAGNPSVRSWHRCSPPEGHPDASVAVCALDFASEAAKHGNWMKPGLPIGIRRRCSSAFRCRITVALAPRDHHQTLCCHSEHSYFEHFQTLYPALHPARLCT